MKFEILRKLDKDKLVWIAFIALGAVIAIVEWSSSYRPRASEPAEHEESIDTYIPKGHLLVPVEIQNAEQLQSLVGPATVVDLYATGEGRRARLVGRRLRLLRAPANPQVFAVLVRDTEADGILAFTGPFRASIRTPEENAHEVVTTQASLKWDEGGRP